MKTTSCKGIPAALLALLTVGGTASCGGPGCCIGGGKKPPAAAPVRTAPVHNQGPRNGVSPCSLWQNRDLIQVLGTSPLTTATMNLPEVQSRLSDEDTRGLLQYIISCAADPSDPPVTPTLPAGTSGKYMPPWKGEMGLCGSASPWPWGAGGPSQDCQEIVTACVLARVNKLGMRVVISTRAEPDHLFPSFDRIPVETIYRDDVAAPSVLACSGGATDCGFLPRYVGQCVATPGPTGQAKVKLVADEPLPGVTIRACKGLHACNPGDAGQRYYSQHIADGAPSTNGPASLEIDCPANGPMVDGKRTGYYSVLVKGADVDVSDVFDNGSYPAPEAAVFTYREGAFFGNLFDTAALKEHIAADPCPGSGKMLAGDEFACYSEVWSDGLAHYNDRWCAAPTTPCFVNAPMPCLFQPESTTLAVDRACSDQSPPPRPFYQLGRGNADPAGTFPWKHPITVYLNHPCDTVLEKGKNNPSCPGFSVDIQ